MIRAHRPRSQISSLPEETKTIYVQKTKKVDPLVGFFPYTFVPHRKHEAFFSKR